MVTRKYYSLEEAEDEVIKLKRSGYKEVETGNLIYSGRFQTRRGETEAGDAVFIFYIEPFESDTAAFQVPVK